MKFIDFFAGIGGIRLGLERAGHECVGFCEWDKFARQSYKAMYDTEGEWENHDIRTAKSYGLPSADLWCFGFPCQDLSVAGKRKGLQEGERSGLFYEIIRLLQGLRQEDRPKWLLAENVKGLFSAGGGFDFLRCIVELGGLGYSIEWQLLNSKDFGVPQNRERVFIVGHFGDGSRRKVFPIQSTDGENTCRLQEITKGVADGFRIYKSEGIARTLKSEGGGLGAKMGLYAVDNIKVIGNYSPSGHEASRVLDPTGIAPTVMENHGTVNAVAIDLTENNPKITETARCLQSRYNKGYSTKSAECSGALCIGNANPSGNGMNGNVFDSKGISPALTTNKGEGYKVLVKPVLTPEREEKKQNGRRIKEDGEPIFTLTAQDKHGVAIIGGLQEHQKVRTDGISPTLTQAMGMGGGQTPCILGTRIRKLTPRECWRLQGFPDEYFDKAVAAGVSNSQLYKQAGNGVTVNVAEAIGRRLREIEMAVSE